ncbi:MAG: 3-phosphoshikimate 1-carboxyvinyltransferase [Azospirillaceae bacterium]
MSTAQPRRPLSARRAPRLAGDIRVPGDKSMSHRALMLGAVAVGRSRIGGLLEGEDVLATAAAMRALGAGVTRLDDGVWQVDGVGVGGLTEPATVLDLGNSGTSARLLTGLLASHPFTSFLTGDASLSKRPMARVTEPLSRMGASFVTRSGGRLPMAVIGTGEPIPISHTPTVASAQVKSAVLLAGLNTPGETTVIEARPTRDYTESMLRHFGAEVRVEETERGADAITIVGQPELVAGDIAVPGDISSAAFPLVAAAIVADARLTIRNVGMNPRRTGLVDCLLEMGADLRIENARTEGGEPVADLAIVGGGLRGIDVPPERVPSMIDEFPVLAVAAACAEGPTRMTGIGELRVKESDRLAMVADGLAACGVKLEAGEDWLTVHGTGRPPQGGAMVATALDHRIAMSFLVLGLASAEPVTVDDGRPIETSFPGFAELLNGLAGEALIAPPSGLAA